MLNGTEETMFYQNYMAEVVDNNHSTYLKTPLQKLFSECIDQVQ